MASLLLQGDELSFEEGDTLYILEKVLLTLKTPSSASVILNLEPFLSIGAGVYSLNPRPHAGGLGMRLHVHVAGVMNRVCLAVVVCYKEVRETTEAMISK